MASDWELLERWRQSDAGAAETLIDRYYAPMRRFFANKVATAHEAEDCVHETFTACVEGRDRIRDELRFRSYIYAIAQNVLRRYIAKKGKREREVADFASICVNNVAPSMTSIMARRREEMLVVAALRELPIEQQIVLELYLFEDLSGSEIAELLDVPEGTVRGRIRLGQDRLKRQIAELSSSQDECAATLTDLVGWARKIRTLIDEREDGGSSAP